ncbi:hypothetical protein, partial [Salmonella enterica]|uniref:hypothetical protein n=1 Tax=Salmonella enterica TaxID=28901 RepID=UPI0020C2ADC3
KLTAELPSYEENAKAFEFHKNKELELEIGYRDSVLREQQLQIKYNTLDVNLNLKIKSLNAEIFDLKNQVSKKQATYSDF